MSDNILALYTNVYTQCGRSLDNEIGHQSSRFRVAGKTRGTTAAHISQCTSVPWQNRGKLAIGKHSHSAVHTL